MWPGDDGLQWEAGGGGQDTPGRGGEHQVGSGDGDQEETKDGDGEKSESWLVILEPAGKAHAAEHGGIQRQLPGDDRGGDAIVRRQKVQHRVDGVCGDGIFHLSNTTFCYIEHEDYWVSL